MSWAEVAKIKSAEEAANVKRKADPTVRGPVDKTYVPFFTPNPFYLLLGNPKCRCDKTGYDCDRSDCGFTRQ